MFTFRAREETSDSEASSVPLNPGGGARKQRGRRHMGYVVHSLATHVGETKSRTQRRGFLTESVERIQRTPQRVTRKGR